MKKIFTLIAMLAATLGMQAQDTWTVAGEKAILGESWKPAAEVNDMTSTDGVNFTLVKTGIMVAANETGYGYKVAKNHAWDEAYPEADAHLSIPEDAEYTLTFTFNADSKEVNATAEKTGAYVKPEGDDIFTVVGAKELTGFHWDTEGWEGTEVNNMTTTDKKTYKLQKTGLLLEKDTPYEFKFVKNQGEAWYGVDGGSDNYQIKLDENGEYTVDFTFDAETLTGSFATTKTGEYTPGEKTWTICGVAALCGSNWKPADTSNDMTKVAEGEFELTRTNVALLADTEYEYKVAANHAWTESYGKDGGSANQIFSVTEDGAYDVTFVFLLETKSLSATGETTGINMVSVKAVKSAPIYNLQGQRVDGNYRGIAIQNGKKMLMK